MVVICTLCDAPSNVTQEVITSLLIILTLSRYVPEGVYKLEDNTKLGTGHQSVQSGAGKVSCNKTALYSCTSTEILCNRKALSLSSPEV